jgi:hypothetical protein
MQKDNLMVALTFGNHKGASSQPELLQKLVKKDVTHGFGLIILLSVVSSIPGALLAPVNIIKQNTIDKQGQLTLTKALLGHPAHLSKA